VCGELDAIIVKRGRESDGAGKCGTGLLGGGGWDRWTGE